MAGQIAFRGAMLLEEKLACSENTTNADKKHRCCFLGRDLSAEKEGRPD